MTKDEAQRRRWTFYEAVKFEAQEYDLDWVVRHVAQLLGMEPPDVLARGNEIDAAVMGILLKRY